MRIVGAIAVITLVTNAPLQAAMFNCEFSAANASTTPLTCSVDSTKITPCRQSYSPTLMALCQGGRSQSSTTTFLRCYFADPGGASQLDDKPASDMAAALKAVSGLPSIHTVAMEWIPASSPASDMGLLYNEPGQTSSLLILCHATP